MEISVFLALKPEQQKELETLELTADRSITLSELQAVFKALLPCLKLQKIAIAKGALSQFPKEILGNALLQAAMVGNVALGAVLLEQNSALMDYTVTTDKLGQQSALTTATLQGHSGFVDFLLKKGSTYGEQLNIYLLNVVKMGHVATAKLLLDIGAKVDFIYNGQSILEKLVAVPQKSMNHTLMLQLLLEYGAGLSKTLTPALVEKISTAFPIVNFNVGKEFDKVKFIYPYNKILVFTMDALEKSLRSDDRLPRLFELSSNQNKIDLIPEVAGLLHQIDDELRAAARQKYRH